MMIIPWGSDSTCKVWVRGFHAFNYGPVLLVFCGMSRIRACRITFHQSRREGEYGKEQRTGNHSHHLGICLHSSRGSLFLLIQEIWSLFITSPLIWEHQFYYNVPYIFSTPTIPVPTWFLIDMVEFRSSKMIISTL